MPPKLARKSARRKQQTRLTFEPIEPIEPDLRGSSPSTNMSPANIRYHLPNRRSTPSSSRIIYAVDYGEQSDDPLSSSKKSNMVKPAKSKGRAKADGKLPFKALPTPVKSSQTMARGSSSFAKHLTMPEISEDEIEGNKIRSQNRNSDKYPPFPTGASSSKSRPRPVVDLDESDGSPQEDEVDTPSKKKMGKKKQDFSWSPHRELHQDEETDDLPPTAPKSSRGSAPKSASNSKAKSRRQKSVTLSSDTDNVFHAPKSSEKRKAGRPKKILPAVEEDNSDDFHIASSSRRQRTIDDDDESGLDLPVISKLMKFSKLSANGKAKNSAIQIEEDSDDEDVVPTSTIRRRPRIATSAEESDEEPTSPLRKRGRDALAESDDSDIRSSPWKRRKVIHKSEDEDDNSDLPSVQDIQSSRRVRSRSRSSSSAGTIPNRVTRQAKARKHRTEREKKMELLKRKRAGEDIDELTDSTEASSEPKRGVYDTDSDLESLSDFEDEESELEIVQKPKKKTNINSYHLSDDSDFIVEDDEDPLGVPLGLLDIPLKFRHAAHKPMKEHFKDAIEWMVHRKINPGFSRDDEIYFQAFTKLDDEYQGYAKSKFVSSQWTAEFTRAIYARPVLIERPCGPDEGYTIDGLPKCDVCNHRKHFPKFAIHFEGKAYHKSTLEEVERQDSEDEDSDSDDALSVDSNGHSLPAEDKEWFSGIVCRDNAQQAHALIHWKYALNEWVIDQLENEGYLTPDKLAEREKMKAKKRRDHANEVVDGWEATGIIKNLYRDFKSQLEAARESKQGRWEKVRG